MNYGIKFCQQGIRILEAKEDELLANTGFGFDKFSQEWRQLCTYQRLLRQFKADKEAGRRPSYNPEVHGSLSS